MVNYDWTSDELTLAFDLVRRNGGRAVRSHDPRAVELSRVLRGLPIHPVEGRMANFRSPESVQRKTFDIETGEKGYVGRRTKGSGTERIVREWFRADPIGMAHAAEGIRSLVGLSQPFGHSHLMESMDDVEFNEGGLLLRLHAVRERDPRLRSRKLADIESATGHLACEVCGFDFAATYGDRGQAFLEVHHVVPLHVTGPRTTRVSDLAAVCSNCHRMLHRRPVLTPPELRQLVLPSPEPIGGEREAVAESNLKPFAEAVRRSASSEGAAPQEQERWWRGGAQ